MKNWKKFASNYPYLIWILFYAILLWLMLSGLMLGRYEISFTFLLLLYFICFSIASLPEAELIWRAFQGVREIATNREKERLLPLFKEVYEEAKKVDKDLFKDIKLFIKDTMEINAFAFGQRTLVITKGSINLLSDDDLKGLMAHELGHFSNYDTVAIVFSSVSNIIMESFLRFLCWITRPIKFINNFFIGIHKGLVFIGDLILMDCSRKHEFLADNFASKCGYGENLTSTLYQFYETSMSEPTKFIEQLRSTHPPLVNRIEKLEEL